MTDEPLRTDRVGLLRDQLDSAWQIGAQRLTGLTDEEMFWEPVDGAWSLRPRDTAVTDHPFGPGGWQLDYTAPEPDPAPVTTIAWRLGHLTNCLQGRWEYTLGPRTTDPADVVDFASTAAGAVGQLASAVTAWRDGVDTLSDAELDRVGFGTYPWGLDPGLPIIAIVWWCNRELIHHLAEVALLRDLWLRHGNRRGMAGGSVG